MHLFSMSFELHSFSPQDSYVPPCVLMFYQHQQRTKYLNNFQERKRTQVVPWIKNNNKTIRGQTEQNAQDLTGPFFRDELGRSYPFGNRDTYIE